MKGLSNFLFLFGIQLSIFKEEGNAMLNLFSNTICINLKQSIQFGFLKERRRGGWSHRVRIFHVRFILPLLILKDIPASFLEKFTLHNVITIAAIRHFHHSSFIIHHISLFVCSILHTF